VKRRIRTWPSSSPASRIAHVSHRSGSALTPENTLLAFKRAVEVWLTDQIERDIRMSRDGVPVVIHDVTVGTVTEPC